MDSSTLNTTDKELLVDYLMHGPEKGAKRDARILDLLQVSLKHPSDQQLME